MRQGNTVPLDSLSIRRNRIRVFVLPDSIPLDKLLSEAELKEKRKNRMGEEFARGIWEETGGLEG